MSATTEKADAPASVRFINGPTTLLNSGAYLDLLEPEKCAFTIDDIAHGLSHVCRFAGQCARFYSVAEHSYHVSHVVPAAHAYAGLMHDAAEAFIGDITKPLKMLLPEYKVIEQRMEAAIFARFGVPPLGPEIRAADGALLATEQVQLMRNSDDWEFTRGHRKLSLHIECWAPTVAKAMFLDRFKELKRQLGALK